MMCLGRWDCGRSEASVEGWRQSVVASWVGFRGFEWAAFQVLVMVFVAFRLIHRMPLHCLIERNWWDVLRDPLAVVVVVLMLQCVCVCGGGVGMQQSTCGCQTPSEAASMEEEPPVVVGSPSSLLPGPQVNLGLTTITKYFSYSKLWRKL